jgi:hypothetical protein
VKIYTAMKPKDAARIFAALDDSVRIGVAGRMKADVMAGILAALPSDVAQKVTVELANRYKAPADPAALAAPTASAPATQPASPAATAPTGAATAPAAAAKQSGAAPGKPAAAPPPKG